MSKRKRPVLVIDPEDLSDGRSESDSIPGDTSNTAIPSRDDDASDTSSGESLPQPFQRRKGDGLREADGRHNGEIGASMREVNGRLKGESGDGRPANDIRVERKKFGYVTERIEGQGGPFMAVQAAGEESTTPPVEMDDLDAIAAAIPCDTLAAVLFLRSSFPASISKVASSLPSLRPALPNLHRGTAPNHCGPANRDAAEECISPSDPPHVIAIRLCGAAV
ncbi:hypothetical protein CLOP_g20452 [Closterium sp. NIES-67]|nr:hypothetical protein CLOP_g20452 [Closterium sp. NIES-67]